MKINTNRILPGGLCLEEEVAASTLDLETEIIKFRKPIKIKADIAKITNALSADVFLKYSICVTCGRCLKEAELDFNKNFILNYMVSKSESVIDLSPDIREEIILDYPLKPLCNPDCKGLCPKCGKDLNEGECNCR
jgi:uncharacterized protein